MPPPNDTAAATSELVGQIQANARKLGLTWQLVKATVVDGADVSAINATVDGDTVPVGMPSMIGALAAGTRVWVVVLPPGGNYIAGVVTGGASNYFARQTLTATATSVTFSGIPQGLRRMRVSYQARADNAVNVQFLQVRVNGDSSAVYVYETILAQNATVAAGPGVLQTSGVIGMTTGTLSPAGIFGSGQAELIGWDTGGTPGSSHLNYTFMAQALGSAAATFSTSSGGGVYSATRPYTSLTLFPQAGNFVAGTDIQLEGWPS